MKSKINTLCWGLITVVMIPVAMFLIACQHNEIPVDSEIMLKTAVIPELTLNYPDDEVCVSEEFTISFTSTCGRVMIERGYINGEPVVEEDVIVGYEKIYVDLTCDMDDLQWECLGEWNFSPCTGGDFIESYSEPGNYVYRAKINPKAVKNSGCPDCDSFKGVLFECFSVKVVECNSGTFLDDRDSSEYDWIRIGEQVWMAENLAYLPSVNTVDQGSQTDPRYYVYGNNGTDVAAARSNINYSTYGVLYNWPAANISCPNGWHLPSHSEWLELKNFLIDNGYGYQGGGEDIAKALAATTNWNLNNISGTPGNQCELNNSSGFSVLPAGYRVNVGIFNAMGEHNAMWSSEGISSMGDTWGLMWDYDYLSNNYNDKAFGFSVRCIKD